MCHVLVIEDEPFIAMQIEGVLLDGGADTVTIAATEQDAVSSAAARRPDFVASDVRLLEGSGPAAVEAIRRMYPVPVTFITAWPEACSQCRDYADILVKPISAASLLASFKRSAPACG
jgi:two-component system, response regulator PdtaR